MENKQQFEIIARSIVILENKILLCRARGKEHFYLPGGHVEFGEKAEDALKREFQEEMAVKVRDIQFVGVVENYFTQNEEEHHELNLVFSAKMKEMETRSMEDHISFTWIPLAELPEANVKPIALRDAVVQWAKDQKDFFVSQI